MNTKAQSLTRLFTVIAIVFVLNLVAQKLYFRLDFTADQRYTLSNYTKGMLKDLDDVVTIKAYFTENLPAKYANLTQDFRDMLVEYERRSGGSIEYEFIDPADDKELQQKLARKGVAQLTLTDVQDDKAQQIITYMGAVVEMQDRSDVISVVDPNVPVEYQLSKSIQTVANVDKPTIAFLQGHGEPGMEEHIQFLQSLKVSYSPEPFTLSDTIKEIPITYPAVIINNPTDTFSVRETQLLDQYLNKGGAILANIFAVSPNISTGRLQDMPDIGLLQWLEKKNIYLTSQYVIDANCGQVNVQRRVGAFNMSQPIEFPYFPVIQNFYEHPVVNGLESILFPVASPIVITATDSAAKIVPLARSSELSGVKSPPGNIDVNKQWTESDFTNPDQIVAVAASGNLGTKAGSQAKMVVVSNGSYLHNGSPQQPQQLPEDNINLAANAIDWLTGNQGLAALRTKTITQRPLNEVDDFTRNLLKYANVFLPVLILLLYGLYRKRRFAMKQKQWLEEKY